MPGVFVFQNISGLAFERFADGFKGGQSDGLCPAVLQYGDVGHRDADLLGKLGDAHLPLRQHHIDVNNDCHAR